MQKINIKGLTLRELENFALSIGEKRFRGHQLFDWLYSKQVSTFDEMTSISKLSKQKLAECASIESIKVLNTIVSKSDGTTKYLFELSDGCKIESVLIPPQTAFDDPKAGSEEEQRRLTLCVSTQVGCSLGCEFCATGKMGFVRNLTTGEIIDQVIQTMDITGRRVTNIVYMGMGEPFLNYENVMNSLEILILGFGIAARRITISTVGVVPQIRQLADEKWKVKLAVSLHTLDNEKRSRLIPLNRKFPLDELLSIISYYYNKVKRRVTFEYILFDGWNDTDMDINRLVKLSRTIPCKINIIPFHSIAFTHPIGIASKLFPTPPKKVLDFVQCLRESNVTVFIRSSTGEDITAACGQLAILSEIKSTENFIRNPSRYGVETK